MSALLHVEAANDVEAAGAAELRAQEAAWAVALLATRPKGALLLQNSPAGPDEGTGDGGVETAMPFLVFPVRLLVVASLWRDDFETRFSPGTEQTSLRTCNIAQNNVFSSLLRNRLATNGVFI